MVSITVHGSHEIPVLGTDDVLGPFGRPDTPRMGPTNEASAMESSFGPDSSSKSASATRSAGGTPKARTEHTGSDDISVLPVHICKRSVAVTCSRHSDGPWHGDPAPDGTGVLGKR